MNKYRITYIHSSGIVSTSVSEARNEWEAVYEDAYLDATTGESHYLKDGWRIDNVELVPDDTEVGR